jgi:hypothetical protein
MTGFSPCLYGQSYLLKEKENDIKVSGEYYWGECSDFSEDNARQGAFVELSNLIINDAVNQSIKQDEILKAIELGAHFDRVQQKGKVKILAWIAKDSVFVTIQKPITQSTPTQPIAAQSADERISVVGTPITSPNMDVAPTLTQNPVQTDNPILKELLSCKTSKDIHRVARTNGLVRGINSSDGFPNPEKCFIAVFVTDGTLLALYDVGDGSRTDLLTGKTALNPEQLYDLDSHFLWYLQQKNN